MKRTIILLLFGLFGLQARLHALELPFLWPTDPSLDPTCTNSVNLPKWLSNARTLTFTPKDFVAIVGGNTNYAGGSSLALNWPASRQTMMMLTNLAMGLVFASVQINVGFVGFTNAITSQEAATKWQQLEAQSGYPPITYQSSGTIYYEVRGSSIGDITDLRCTTWVNDKYSPSDSSSSDNQFLQLMIDWGDGGSGGLVHEFVWIQMLFSVQAVSTDFQYLPASAVCSTLLGGSATAQDYVTPVVQGLVNDLASGALFLHGAPPEFLVFYDMSPLNSINPNLLPAGLYSLPPSTTQAQRLQSLANNVNQYDSGTNYSLPTRFSNPPPPSGFAYTPGGNSCGVISLRLALNWAGATASALNATNIYANVMGPIGFTTADNQSNSYDWWAAKDWINGNPKRHGTSKPFTQALGLPSGTRCNLLIGTNSKQISASWSYVDAMLAKRLHPLLLRTDLGGGQQIGGGHVILLVGMGRSDYVAQAYGTSGDYYVVADPAGHYFANTNGVHYGRSQYLMDQNIAINQSGWYAIYPKELLQQRIKVKGTPNARFCAEGINLPWESLQVDIGSPTTLLVTDGLGNWTGIQTNGVVVANIPNSAYDAEWADEEEDGTSGYVPDGIKTVVINSPQVGSYQAKISGTNDGTFTLSWSDTAGGHDFSGVVTNAIQHGQQLAYNLGMVPPSLGIDVVSRQVFLSWSTNIPGFVLKSENPLGFGAWSTITTNPPLVSGQYQVNIPRTNNAQFFRLEIIQ
jgi:hypothetical protein